MLFQALIFNGNHAYENLIFGEQLPHAADRRCPVTPLFVEYHDRIHWWNVRVPFSAAVSARVKRRRETMNHSALY